MASYTVDTAKHATTGVAVVDTITFLARGKGLRVRNRDATTDLYFRFDGNNPASLGDDSYFVGPGEDLSIDQYGASEVRVIAAAATAYTVEVY